MPFIHYQTAIFVTPLSVGGDQVAVYKDDSNNQYRVHFYYNNGTFRAFNDLAPATQVDIYIQGGGGGGATGSPGAPYGGGGGAGQWGRFLTIPVQNNTDCNIVIGQGGLPDLPGGTSSFSVPSGPTYSSLGGTAGVAGGAGTPNNGNGGLVSQGGFSSNSPPGPGLEGGGGGGGTNTGGTGQGQNGNGVTFPFNIWLGGAGGVGISAGPFLTGPNGQRVQLFTGAGGGGGASRNAQPAQWPTWGRGRDGGGDGVYINGSSNLPFDIPAQSGQLVTRGVFGPFGSGGGGGGGGGSGFGSVGSGANGWVAVVVPFEEV
jgi:hypothetical protein